MPITEILLERELTTKEFLESISENGNRIVFQLLSDPPFVFRSVSLGGSRPPMSVILDTLAGRIKTLKYVYGYSGERWKISYADYSK
jgi:hypothetical protein